MSTIIPSLKNVEHKVIFSYVVNAFQEAKYNNCLELMPKDKNLPIDYSNLPRDKDRFLLRLLEHLGIDYTISFRTPTYFPPFLGRKGDAFLKMRFPHDWTSDYQAISERISKFEAEMAKQQARL